MHEVLLLVVGFLVAFVGSMSGGGAGLLSISTLLYLGLPINQAIATNKFSDLGFFLPSVRNFTKANQIKKKALPPIIAIKVGGAIIGTLLITHLDVAFFKKLVAVILLAIIISTLTHKNYATNERPPRWYWPIAYFGASISSGAVGAGTGILSTLTLMYFRGFNALQSMAHSFFASIFGSTVSLVILLFTDLINYRFAIFLLIGNIIGAHLGSKIAIQKGNKFVRIMIIILSLTVVLQLIFT